MAGEAGVAGRSGGGMTERSWRAFVVPDLPDLSCLPYLPVSLLLISFQLTTFHHAST
jgi:hypothetical protein